MRRRYMHGRAGGLIKGWRAARNGGREKEREGVSTEAEEEVTAGGGKHRRRRQSYACVIAMARACERANRRARPPVGWKGIV